MSNQSCLLIYLIYLIHFKPILDPYSGDPVILDPIFSGNPVLCQYSTGVPAPIQTDLKDPNIDVFSNHVTCDIKEVQKPTQSS